jgi:hypothetical protein
MGKASKHMKHKCIFLNDLRACLENEKAGKQFDNTLHVGRPRQTLTVARCLSPPRATIAVA